jgi:vacuolar protein sorting-associated protein 13A/C
MRLAIQLGNLSLSDDSDLPTRSPEFKQILSIEGSDLADLTYETFDPGDKESFKGINSSVSLRSGALKIYFLEKPLHSVYHFLIKFARLKSLYDTATQVAVQRASEIQRMKFDVAIQSPIVIFPSNSIDSDDKIIMRLGQISARNDYQGDTSTIVASLSGISLTSETTLDGEVSELTIVDSVQINGDVIQNPEILDDTNNRKPDNQVRCPYSAYALKLTINHTG